MSELTVEVQHCLHIASVIWHLANLRHNKEVKRKPSLRFNSNIFQAVEDWWSSDAGKDDESGA